MTRLSLSQREESLGCNVGNSLSFLSLVSYTFLSLIKLRKESGTYMELFFSLISFALGGNETLALSSILHSPVFKEGKLDIY
jgi:hypothetical protein